MTEMIDPAFWAGRRVFITGHTGFKGGWLSLWLADLGAEVTGFALPPGSPLGFFETLRLGKRLNHLVGDIRDRDALARAIDASRPEIVIHMAAQALVRPSYDDPSETYATNVQGTVHLLDAVRAVSGVRAVIVVTSDKCYAVDGGHRRFVEGDRLGGHDPYSSSKACAELVTASYRQSYFGDPSAAAVATVRAGNVIGGGDWAVDRLVPDAIRAFGGGEPLRLRRPDAIRPWQHVLEPLCGYLTLAERLASEGASYAEAWNFGPDVESEQPVGTVARKIAGYWGSGAVEVADVVPFSETSFLRLDSSKARARLGWRPRLSLDQALGFSVDWYAAQVRGEDMLALSRSQISRYLAAGETAAASAAVAAP